MKGLETSQLSPEQCRAAFELMARYADDMREAVGEACMGGFLLAAALGELGAYGYDRQGILDLVTTTLDAVDTPRARQVLDQVLGETFGSEWRPPEDVPVEGYGPEDFGGSDEESHLMAQTAIRVASIPPHEQSVATRSVSADLERARDVLNEKGRPCPRCSGTRRGEGGRACGLCRYE